MTKNTPFNEYLGAEVTRLENGFAEGMLELKPHHLNRRGVAHGGVITALLDSALGGAVISSMPPEWWCATTSLSTLFVDGARGGKLVATGQVVRRGAKVAFATGEVRDERGRVIATASGTWHLWNRRPRGSQAATPAGHVSVEGGSTLRVGKILAVGRNYADHVAEMGAPPAGPPVIFLKPASALVHDQAEIALPEGAGSVHHEVELVVLIGTGGKSIAVDRALEHVEGYAVGLDLTLRDVQSEAKKRGEPWSLSKGFDGSAPVSSFVPREKLGDGSGLEISLDVNGERRQEGNTSQMLRSVAEMVAHTSRWLTLDRGDLLFSGTPAGVGPIRPGDRLEARLEGVRPLRVSIT